MYPQAFESGIRKFSLIIVSVFFVVFTLFILVLYGFSKIFPTVKTIKTSVKTNITWELKADGKKADTVWIIKLDK